MRPPYGRISTYARHEGGVRGRLGLCRSGGRALSFASAPLQHASEPPPDEASVVVRNLSLPGAFEIENRGPDIELAWAVTIQRELKGEWSDHATDLTLIEKCGQSPPSGCVPLPHGAKLRPARWNGLTCGSQCAATCRANLYLGPGRFRFVVTSCDGKRKFRGPAFELPSQVK
jgi:hypothetical protein